MALTTFMKNSIQSIKIYLHRLANPESLLESFYLVVRVVQLAGIYPYRAFYSKDDPAHDIVSYPALMMTFLNITLYSAANYFLIFYDTTLYTESLISERFLGVMGELMIKILDTLISVAIFVVIAFRLRKKHKLISFGMKELMKKMGIDLKHVFRGLLIFSIVQSLLLTAICLFCIYKAIALYMRVKGETPSFVYFIVVIMSNVYKLLEVGKFMSYIVFERSMIIVLNKHLARYLPDEPI
ncbi:unnamed protein product [Hermetia illucens]|uniref:Uncharacterized protein n=1 Tax=Hermetia illucens TaxID=343691 RepID=A0A7R8Z0K5_HERIL|nr:unnamed protein product [Hermetia illucens]